MHISLVFHKRDMLCCIYSHRQIIGTLKKYIFNVQIFSWIFFSFFPLNIDILCIMYTNFCSMLRFLAQVQVGFLLLVTPVQSSGCFKNDGWSRTVCARNAINRPTVLAKFISEMFVMFFPRRIFLPSPLAHVNSHHLHARQPDTWC